MLSHPLFRTGTGRLRLPWRLALFLILGVVFTFLMGPLLADRGMAVTAWGPLLAAVASGVILLRMDGRGPEALGFHFGRGAVTEAGLGLALGATVALTAVVGMTVAGGVAWSTEPGTPAGWLRTGAASLWLFLAPAAAEEAIFRGYPFQALVQGVGTIPSLVLASGLFGALHGANPGATIPGVLNTGVAGVFLSLVFLRTASLWWASGAHLGWNWAHGFLADMPVSGLDLVDAPYLAARPTGEGWISGGAFGPEGSLVTTAVLVAATLWAWRTPRLRPARAVVEAGPLAVLEAGAFAAADAGPGSSARDASPDGSPNDGPTREGHDHER